MKAFSGEAMGFVDAPADAVFGCIIDPRRLPEWNQAIESVVDAPSRLEEGSTWTVTMHPPRSPRWGSISQVETLDPSSRRFVYETRNTDGNPSSVRWSWSVADCDGGAEVTVRWECSLRTLDRRVLAGPIRKRGLAREVPRSLDAVAALLRPSAAG